MYIYIYTHIFVVVIIIFILLLLYIFGGVLEFGFKEDIFVKPCYEGPQSQRRVPAYSALKKTPIKLFKNVKKFSGIGAIKLL